MSVDSNLAHSDSGDCLPVTSVPPEAMALLNDQVGIYWKDLYYFLRAQNAKLPAYNNVDPVPLFNILRTDSVHFNFGASWIVEHSIISTSVVGSGFVHALVHWVFNESPQNTTAT